MITLLLLLIIIVMVTLLSVQNAMPVLLTLLYWKFEVSLAFIMVSSVLVGIITGTIVSAHFKKKPPKNLQPHSEQDTISS